MDHYIDISILPTPEFPETVLLNALYTKLHRALYDLAATNVGVSFPKYKITLGNIIRIHSGQAVLHNLLNLNWIGSMNDLCKVSMIMRVPMNSKFRNISRKQPTMSPSKLRRLISRGSILEEEIQPYETKMHSKKFDNPYIELISTSSGQRYRRYIEFGELLEQPVSGSFDAFGFSKTATVPWFD
ncbi:type I-F CRISPR-associated endoribonuclease Cas6/Csy4 [Legionella dresdenensis]|uniref:Type I-F CRISPR-associated endoribonuclease Cas6/Csy4 n=1 Tax=Legionella dresdenensis TaxID=450200 RepID=A0ABV8CH76_9GAMM